MANQYTDLDRAFHALSDPTRRAIVARLAQGPASVTALSQPFSMAMPTLLQHIRVLEEGGLVVTKKEGRVRTCSIRPAAFATACGWLDRQRSIWEERLDRMEAYVAELQAREKKHGKRNR